MLPAGILVCLIGWPAIAEDVPAVSAPNAKVEFDAGALSLPSAMFMARAAGTVTLPIGARFGLQADLSASTSPGFVTTGALHFFTRDPKAYLVGGTLGFVHSPGATVLAAGPEAELYLDRWTVEAWGGIAAAFPSATTTPSRIGPFVMANAGYYFTDNWRGSVGVSWLDNYGAVQIGSEYLLEDFSLPLALTSEMRFGQDGAMRATLGLRGYFGPNPSKSLISRHREDDPADRSAALYAAAGGRTLVAAPAEAPVKSAGDSLGDDQVDNTETETGSDPACIPDPPPGYPCPS